MLSLDVMGIFVHVYWIRTKSQIPLLILNLNVVFGHGNVISIAGVTHAQLSCWELYIYSIICAYGLNCLHALRRTCGSSVAKV